MHCQSPQILFQSIVRSFFITPVYRIGILAASRFRLASRRFHCNVWIQSNRKEMRFFSFQRPLIVFCDIRIDRDFDIRAVFQKLIGIVFFYKKSILHDGFFH